MPSAERVTHVVVSDITVRAWTIALVRLDNGTDKPLTLGLQGLRELRDALAAQRERADAGQIHAVAVTGRPGAPVRRRRPDHGEPDRRRVRGCRDRAARA